MTLLVEVGLAVGSTIDPTYLLLGSATQGVLDVNRLAPADTFADLSGREMDLQVDHQSSRTGPLVEYSARTCTLTLLDDDGALDPATLEAAGLTAPGSILRIRKLYGGTVWPVFTGTVDTWVPEHRYPTHATVTITATDGFSLLEAQDRDPAVLPVGAGETTGARAARVLDAASWPASARSLAAGRSTLAATDMDGTALNELQDVARNEVGEFYVQADGVAYFRDRWAVVTDPRSATSQVTFGSGVGEIPYVGRPGFAWDKTQLANLIRAAREAGASQASSDATSVGRYGLHSPGEVALALQTDAEVLAWTRYVLAQDKDPESRFTSLDLECAADPAVLFPQALGRRFGDRVTVVRRPPAVPPGSIVDAREVFLRSVSHTWSADRPGMWRTTWGLQPAGKYPLFVLDSATNGVLDRNVLAY